MRRLFFHEESIHEVSRRYLDAPYTNTHTHTHTRTSRNQYVPHFFKVGGIKNVYINGTGDMIKMAAMLIHGKKPSKIFSYRTNSRMIMKHGMEKNVFKFHKVYINNDPELTLTHS